MSKQTAVALEQRIASALSNTNISSVELRKWALKRRRRLQRPKRLPKVNEKRHSILCCPLTRRGGEGSVGSRIQTRPAALISVSLAAAT